MDLFQSRLECRRLIRAAVGDSTDELVSSQQTVQVNALIDQAAHKVAGESRWLALQRRASVGIDTAQELLGYQAIEQAYWLELNYASQYLPLTYGTAADSFNPSDLATADLKYIGPGNIIEVAVWNQDERRYYKVPKARIPIDQDMDRWAKAAQEAQRLGVLNGDTAAEINASISAETSLSEAQRGLVQWCQPRLDGIHFWPISDQRRVLRVQYVISPSWEYHAQVLTPTQIDQIPSAVDALAIQYQVISDLFAQQGDEFQSLRFCNDDGVTKNGQRGTGKFWDRIRQLKGWQNTGERIAMDRNCTFDEDTDTPDRTIPNWQLGPIVRGTSS
jgi:hypothetical protein